MKKFYDLTRTPKQPARIHRDLRPTVNITERTSFDLATPSPRMLTYTTCSCKSLQVEFSAKTAEIPPTLAGSGFERTSIEGGQRRRWVILDVGAFLNEARSTPENGHRQFDPLLQKSAINGLSGQVCERRGRSPFHSMLQSRETIPALLICERTGSTRDGQQHLH
jgi:hypothetical protein